MKRLIALIAGTALLCVMSASAGNITIYDTIYNSAYPGNGVANENGEVEPNCVMSQDWDMEAFLVEINSQTKTKRLQVQSGYDMVNGKDTGWLDADNNKVWAYSGDIFIDVTGDAVYGSAIPQDYSPNANDFYTVSNSKYNWDYVISFDRGSTVPDGGAVLASNGYKVYKIDGTSTDVEVWFDQNNKANPFRLKEGGYQVASGEFTWADKGVNNPAGYTEAGHHYVMGNIDLSFLANDPGVTESTIVTLHYTQGCGNDLLMGQTTAKSLVPDGGLTLVLLGMGMGALGITSRRMRRS